MKAYEWFRTASDRGHVGAKNLYATALLEGTFVEQNLTAAMQLFRETAALGNPFGLFSLGRAYAIGLGVDQDLIEAHAYLNLASAHNHPLAADARASVEQNMTSEQIHSAQQRAKVWKPGQHE